MMRYNESPEEKSMSTGPMYVYHPKARPVKEGSEC